MEKNILTKPMLNEVGGAVKIYEALYCSCIHESSYATISLHRTREGAEKAVQESKDKVKLEHEKHKEFMKKEGMEDMIHAWDVHQDWDIAETELMD